MEPSGAEGAPATRISARPEEPAAGLTEPSADRAAPISTQAMPPIQLPNRPRAWDAVVVAVGSGLLFLSTAVLIGRPPDNGTIAASLTLALGAALVATGVFLAWRLPASLLVWAWETQARLQFLALNETQPEAIKRYKDTAHDTLGATQVIMDSWSRTTRRHR